MSDPRIGVTPTACPQCECILNAARCVTGEATRPKEGDFSVCLECAYVFVFDADLQPVPAVADDFRTLAPEDRQMVHRAHRVALASIRDRKAKRAKI